MAETIIGLFKTEVIHRLTPWKIADAVECETLKWGDGFINRRLLQLIENISLAEVDEKVHEKCNEFNKIVRVFRNAEAVSSRRLWFDLCFSFDGSVLVLQAAFWECLSLDLLSHFQDIYAPAVISVCRCQIAEALVVPLVVVVGLGTVF